MRQLKMHLDSTEKIYKKPDFTTCKINIHEHVGFSHRVTRLP